jgi:hypothetical protein
VCDDIPNSVLFRFVVYPRHVYSFNGISQPKFSGLTFFFILSSCKSTQAYSFSSVSVFNFQKPVLSFLNVVS